ncbi:SDR family NAD(P)-dependent oxidoreductase [Clostridium gasigenes]|uniref:Gluconate 5-dehydrogenase n=1 Tax=Clostridium gasigenes TaxID=94869 RepID=A0A1H0VYJ3_9CLOT|nr:glucose 1-dehydrogenase [Clostridium gasigenes]MBU3090218.1 glucose 1-dehydrogenase [Clostridium gasigenes]SDP83373.1 gluconate 5-dehydrogenase [Clostridium gasigenes]
MSNLFDLTGKVAIITGASSGLGADAARAYAEQGADVALLARRKDKLEELAKEIEATGRRAIAVQCDVADEESVKLAVKEVINNFGRVDILLNNAGVATVGSVETMTVETWDKVMDINVKGIFLMCKYVIPHMTERNYGKIVNIASINAVVANKGLALVRHSYNASKAAVRGLTMGMAATYMENGITVNSIGPGLFESEMTAGTLFKHDAFMNAYNTMSPAGRPGKKGELNGTILYLSSDASSYVTSQHILVDGGMAIV